MAAPFDPQRTWRQSGHVAKADRGLCRFAASKVAKIVPVAADASLSPFPLGRDGKQASLTQIKPLVGSPLLLITYKLG